MCAHITNLLKHFSTQTTTAATQQALRKDLLKEKRLGSWGQTLLRLLEENIKNVRTRLASRGYPNPLVDKIISEVKFTERKNTLTQTQKANKTILPFVTQFHPSLRCLKDILMEKRHLIQNHPLLREIYKDPPLISHRNGKSLKDMLVKAKL